MDGRQEIRRRLTAFSAEVQRLLQSEFPYADARDALEALHTETERRLLKEGRMGDSPAPAAVAALRIEVLKFLNLGIRAAGRILRSTNVRNPLELQRPLRRLAEDLLGSEQSKSLRGLLLASEWVYSPHSISVDPYLPKFVVIGLPAHESANALLIPLAGHELGHTLVHWRDLSQALKLLMEGHIDTVVDGHRGSRSSSRPIVTIKQKTLPLRLNALRVATLYATELFCDFIGLGVFGSAYTRAFSYLLAPGGRTVRSDSHPPTRSRARHIADTAKKWGIALPPTFLASFVDSPEAGELDLLDSKWTLAVDTALDAAVPKIRAKALEVLGSTRPPVEAVVRPMRKCLHLGVPIEGAPALAPILVAAWDAHDEPAKYLPKALGENERGPFLNDVTLKSIEILDYEQTIARARANRGVHTGAGA